MTKQRAKRLVELMDYLLSLEGMCVSITAWGRAVGLRRTPYLIDLVRELEATGIVCYIQGHTTNGLPARFYWLAAQDEPRALAYIQVMIERFALDFTMGTNQ